tara:strand:+ start:343 stop:1344 length:1002 start_codon:yes stop_codon:yes gene_type:complete
MNKKTRKAILPRLRKVSYKNKKHHYHIKDPFSKRKLAIHEGVRAEAKKTGKSMKKAATAKKGRFNVLRIYRRYKKPKECEIITGNMRYMDKKYGLGKTKNICKRQKGGNDDDEPEKKSLPTLQQSVDSLRRSVGVNRLGENAMWEQLVIGLARDGDPRFIHLLGEEPLVAQKTQEQNDGERPSKRKTSKRKTSKGKTSKRKRRKKQKGGKRTRKKQQFLYNPNNPKTSFDVYIDKNPNDTIPIKYTTINDVKQTIKKLESLYRKKKYSHKRIWQVGMIMKVRLEAMHKHKKTLYPKAKNVFQRFKLANKYFKFLGKRSKQKTFKDRVKLKFKF